MRRSLSGFDWSRVDWITVRRVQGDRATGRFRALSGECKLPDAAHASGYRINVRVSRFCEYPITLRSGQVVYDEDEALVWLIAHEAAHYLTLSKQLPGPANEQAPDAFADLLPAEFRELRKA